LGFVASDKNGNTGDQFKALVAATGADFNV
jgi:hypothetical protein